MRLLVAVLLLVLLVLLLRPVLVGRRRVPAARRLVRRRVRPLGASVHALRRAAPGPPSASGPHRGLAPKLMTAAGMSLVLLAKAALCCMEPCREPPGLCCPAAEAASA